MRPFRFAILGLLALLLARSSKRDWTRGGKRR
jgi:hypothetical protein